MPNLKKAELIEGVVYVPSPVSHRYHGKPHYNLIFWLGTYEAGTPGVESGDNSSLLLDLDNEPQPHTHLMILPSHGGRVQIDEDGYVVGAPEWIGEIAASSASYDLNVKFKAYQRLGVKEYVVWRVYDRAIDWFVRRQGRFDRLGLSPSGFYQSKVFPGLWLDSAALMDGNLPAVAQAVQGGLATPEHAAFVARLHRAASRKRP
jgi:hypothetical protein